MDESGVNHSAVSNQDGTISAADGSRCFEPQSANKGYLQSNRGTPLLFLKVHWAELGEKAAQPANTPHAGLMQQPVNAPRARRMRQPAKPSI